MKIVLSLDGGGMRGVTTAKILDYIETKIQDLRNDPMVKLGDLVDFVAGTSTGSILGSLMLLPDKTKKKARHFMSRIVDLYVDMGPEVFKQSKIHNLKTLWGLIGPTYPDSNIEGPLLRMLGHTKMTELIKPCLFTGYDIDLRRANIYTNRDKEEKYGNYYVKDIVRGSTAIPSYFSPALFRDGIHINTIVDGGVFANNPSMVAYVEASKTSFNFSDPVSLVPNDLFFISMGTGISRKKKYPYRYSHKFGKIKWLFPVLDVMLSGMNEVVAYEMKKLFSQYGAEDNYIRINPPLKFSTAPPTDASMENITNLLMDTKNYIHENKIFLDSIAEKILEINHMHIG